MDHEIATVVRDDSPAAGGRWRAFAIFAGDVLDVAVEHAVGAAVEHARPERWAFVRWTDERGPHVRLALDGCGSGDGLRAVMEDALDAAPATPAREPLLAVPASWRGGSHHGVEPIELEPGEEPAHPVHEVSSRVVVDALAHLPDGRARAAHALNLMAATTGPVAESFWRDVAAGWTGDGERGRRLLDRLSRKADELRTDLLSSARELREDRGPLSAGLERYREACGGLDEDAMRHHAHMTANRIGVSPLEEALLALVLAATDPPADDRGGGGLDLRLGESVALVGGPGAEAAELLAPGRGVRLPEGGEDVARALPDGELAAQCTVRENLELRLRAAGSPAGADGLLELGGLGERAADAVADLDLGARRRLSIACGLAGDPAILLLDAPTAGLSAIDRDMVWQLLARRRDRGATTLFATSSMQDALSASDRVALVRDGTIVAVGIPAELAEEHFPLQELHARVFEEPDRALLEDLPDVSGVRIEERVDHWVIEVQTRQPDELRALLRADPDFPEIADTPG